MLGELDWWQERLRESGRRSEVGRGPPPALVGVGDAELFEEQPKDGVLTLSPCEFADEQLGGIVRVEFNAGEGQAETLDPGGEHWRAMERRA